ncbi:hypothetical protein KSX_40270 [Ktedonospora formicarum]|uniref:Uncharacterized protein n=1 Tax=Ktedonospora formicarum TaxID=2778364 RepID=A0A8J3I702_9CHLR|nr:hypothetical protein KSX_40270 [Ktedonospora formicarum]
MEEWAHSFRRLKDGLAFCGLNLVPTFASRYIRLQRYSCESYQVWDTVAILFSQSCAICS